MDETDSSYDKEKLQERLANWLAVLLKWVLPPRRK